MKKTLLMTLLVCSIFSNYSFAKSQGIGNLQKAADGIFRGARPISTDEIQQLAGMGIKNIVDLQGGDMNFKYWKLMSWNEPGELPESIAAEKSVANSLNMGFINAPLDSLDVVTVDEDKLIDDTLNYMHNQSNQPLYVHCEHGKDRTGLIIALYKVKYLGMSVNDAHDEWVNLGHDKKSQILTGGLDVYFYEKVKDFK